MKTPAEKIAMWKRKQAKAEARRRAAAEIVRREEINLARIAAKIWDLQENYW